MILILPGPHMHLMCQSTLAAKSRPLKAITCCWFGERWTQEGCCLMGLYFMVRVCSVDQREPIGLRAERFIAVICGKSQYAGWEKGVYTTGDASAGVYDWVISSHYTHLSCTQRTCTALLSLFGSWRLWPWGPVLQLVIKIMEHDDNSGNLYVLLGFE